MIYEINCEINVKSLFYIVVYESISKDQIKYIMTCLGGK